MFQRIGVMAEGAQADSEALALNDGSLCAPFDTGKLDVLLQEHALGTEDTLLTKVVGMVVGHAQEVEAGLFEPLHVGGGRTEGVDVGTFALGALSTVAEGALKIADGQVGTPEDGTCILKQVGTVVSRQLDGGEGGTHHDVAAHGDAEGVVAVVGG